MARETALVSLLLKVLNGFQEIKQDSHIAAGARHIVWPARLSAPLGSGRATTAENAAHREE